MNASNFNNGFQPVTLHAVRNTENFECISSSEGRFNQHGVKNSHSDSFLIDVSSGALTASTDLQKREVTIADYHLVDESTGKSHLKLKKLAAGIKVILANIKSAVSDAVTCKRLAIGMLTGGIVGGVSGTLLMAALTGGISMVTLLPAAAGTAPVAVVGALIGGASACAGLTGYGVIKGMVKSVAYLCRTPEQRFKHDYQRAEKELNSLESKETRRGVSLRSEDRTRMGILRAFINERKAEYARLSSTVQQPPRQDVIHV